MVHFQDSSAVAMSIDRVRGRKGHDLRYRRLRNHPLCAECYKRGRVTETEEIDHIIPLAFGGTDTEDNVQGLCVPCHTFKSAVESTSTEGAANHPHWLTPSAIPMTIVCGPPCSGKSTYVSEHADIADVVIDLDSILQRIEPSYIHWNGMVTSFLLNSGIRARNAMLGALSKATRGRAWFIVSAPSSSEREWWRKKIHADIVLLNPGIDECKRRAEMRGTPRAIDGIVEWDRKSKLPWTPPRKRFLKSRIGLDGWPEDW